LAIILGLMVLHFQMTISGEGSSIFDGGLGNVLGEPKLYLQGGVQNTLRLSLCSCMGHKYRSILFLFQISILFLLKKFFIIPCDAMRQNRQQIE